MPRPKKPRLSPRKPPSQERSRQLVADILEAAIRVLKKHGARNFTTIRVAQTAGISVGSLYQYFPNKESILFRLQADEWETTWKSLRSVLTGEGPPFERLHEMVRLFFASEAEEAELRVALDDAHALLRNAPEAQQLKANALDDMKTFIAEAVPTITGKQRTFVARYLFTALGAIAEEVTEQRPSPAELEQFTNATALMLEQYLRVTARHVLSS